MKTFTKGRWVPSKNNSVVLAPSKAICEMVKSADSEYNCILISLSPELLESLQELVFCFDNPYRDETTTTGRAMIKAKNLISKVL